MPTLILLPGMDGTGLLFDAFKRALGTTARIRVIGYPADEPLGYEALQLFVKSALPDNEPFFLLAESFSGPIAIEIAAMRNPQLQGLILCCTFARNPRPRLAWSEFLISFVPFKWVPNLAMSHFLLGRFATPVARQAIARAVALVRPAVMRTRARAVMAVDVSGHLPRIRVPILYLRAADDRLVPASACAYIQELSPTARVSVINGPHCLLQVASDEAAAVVSAFLREVEAGSC